MPAILPIRTGAQWKPAKNPKIEEEEPPKAKNVDATFTVPAKKQSHEEFMLEKCKELVLCNEKEQKSVIGTIALEIINNSQENILRLKLLLDYATMLHRLYVSDDNPDALKPLKLVLAVMVTLFSDIIPAYMIRELTDIERATKVSREVAQLRQYEESLVTYYRKYITFLTTKTDIRANDPKLVFICVKALVGLMNVALHFNYHEDILIALSRILTYPSSFSVDKIAEFVAVNMGNVFATDISGFNTCVILKFLASAAQKKSHQIHPTVFVALTLDARGAAENTRAEFAIHREGPPLKTKTRFAHRKEKTNAISVQESKTRLEKRDCLEKRAGEQRGDHIHRKEKQSTSG